MILLGLFDELKRLTRPYEDDDDFFDEADAPVPIGSQSGSGYFGRPERQSFFAEESLDEQEQMMDEPLPPLRIRQESRRERKSKPAPSYGSRGQKVVLITPMHFEDGTGIANHLKDGNTVIMNIENTDKATARRMLDFLSGVAYTLGGKIQKVSGSIFLIMPQNADVLDEVVMGQFSADGGSGYSF